MFRCSVVFVFKYMDTFPCSRNRESGDVVSITSSLVCRYRGICYAMLGPTLLGSAEMGDPERSRGVLRFCTDTKYIWKRDHVRLCPLNPRKERFSCASARSHRASPVLWDHGVVALLGKGRHGGR